MALPTPISTAAAWAFACDKACDAWEPKRSYASLRARALLACSFFVHLPVRPEAVTSYHLMDYRNHLQGHGAKPSVVNKSMVSVSGMLRAMGNEAKVPYVPEPNLPQWFLSTEDYGRLVAEFYGPEFREPLAFIAWTMLTGLRTEESLRLQHQHFTGLGTAEARMHVPGTKTTGSTTVLPLGLEAAAFAYNRMPADANASWPLFGLEYRDLQAFWTTFRKFLGAEDIATATLKSLRRSFAKRSTDKGMPTEVLRRYLRHARIETTLRYLNVVGGFDEATRKWL